MCMHPYKIDFQISTVVNPVEDVTKITLYGFNFVPFPHITSRIHDDSFLVG